MLRRKRLILGGSIENAVVVGDNNILNEEVIDLEVNSVNDLNQISDFWTGAMRFLISSNESIFYQMNLVFYIGVGLPCLFCL